MKGDKCNLNGYIPTKQELSGYKGKIFEWKLKNMRTIFVIIIISFISCNTGPKKHIEQDKAGVDSTKEQKNPVKTTDSLPTHNSEDTEAQIDSDIAYLVYVDKNANKLTYTEIEKFSNMVIDECNKNNAEFGEYSNELIYYLLEVRTKDMVRSFAKMKPSLLDGCFLEQIISPMHTEPFDKIISEVKKTDCNKELKEKIIDALLKGKKYDLSNGTS